jgi:hypothetical protein
MQEKANTINPVLQEREGAINIFRLVEEGKIMAGSLRYIYERRGLASFLLSSDYDKITISASAKRLPARACNIYYKN